MLFKQNNQSPKKNPTPYLDRMDDFEFVQIVRLKGDIDQTMIPVIQNRIEYNRSQGSKIDKNIIVDYKKVNKIDSATIAFHIVRLKEYQEKGFKIGFINMTEQLRSLLAMFHQCDTFKIYLSEEEAMVALNKPV
ncbi:MAG: STAS domain-containing protein [Candidatus Omnitrophica bacterium]|nr:STAS domain-containing protein [Candidatus Omnitrophota bacterium]